MMLTKVQLEREYAEAMKKAAACKKALEAVQFLESIGRGLGIRQARVAKNSAKVVRNGSTVTSNGRKLSAAGRRAISEAQKARHAANRRKRKKSNG